MRKWIAGATAVLYLAVVGAAGATGTQSAAVTLIVNAGKPGEEPRYEVRVTPPAGAPVATGAVSLSEAGVPLTGCTGLTLSDGYVRCASPLLVAGVRGISVTYSGDATYRATTIVKTAGDPYRVSGTLGRGSRPALAIALRPGYAHLRGVTIRVTTPGIHLRNDARELLGRVTVSGISKVKLSRVAGELVVAGFYKQHVAISLASGALIFDRAAARDTAVRLTLTLNTGMSPELTELATVRR